MKTNIIQGVSKKRYFSDFRLISVLQVRLYFFTCVLESEFWARFIQPPRVYSFRILSALKKLKCMRKQLFCRFCTLNIIHKESRMGSKFCLCMCFVGNLYSERVCSRWLDETSSKFWFQNTYEKVKSGL